MQEIWKDILWYNWYQISNLWNVQSFKNWRHWYKKQWKILKNNLQNTWYISVTLLTNKLYLIHRLVAETFICNPENKPQVNHKDWNKLNNRMENLEWVTQKENINHSFKSWLQIIKKWKDSHMFGKIWKLNNNAKKVNQYDLQGNYIKSWDSISDVHRKLKINISNISLCCNWKQKTAWWFIWKRTL